MKTSRAITLAAAAAAAVGALAGCGASGPTAAGAAPGSSRSPVPTASTSAVASPAASAGTPSASAGTPSASSPRCARDEVRIADRAIGAALGHVGVLFTLHNTSAVSCRLFGYAGLELLGPRGRPLPTTVHRAVSGTYLFPAVVPHWVALAPGGYAAFDLEYEDNPSGAQAGEPYSQACPAASHTEVTLPNAYDFSVVPADMAPCGGAVWISPVIPGRAWLKFS